LQLQALGPERDSYAARSQQVIKAKHRQSTPSGIQNWYAVVLGVGHVIFSLGRSLAWNGRSVFSSLALLGKLGVPSRSCMPNNGAL
jgi:hypothetical protein